MAAKQKAKYTDILLRRGLLSVEQIDRFVEHGERRELLAELGLDESLAPPGMTRAVAALSG